MRKLFLFVAIFGAAAAAEPPAVSNAPLPASAVATELSVRDALILGTIEGVTEYLPVSSTGHLIIATHTLGLDSEQQIRGRDNQPLWHIKPSTKHPNGEPLTLKLAADTYTIVIQFGAIAAVALLYWRQIFSMLRGLVGRDPAGLRLLRNLLIAFMPAAVLGLALHDWIDAHLFSVGTVIAVQIAGAFLILWAERWRRKHRPARERTDEFSANPKTIPAISPAGDETTEALDLTARQSLNIGLLQCAALWPGTSRSMMTIIGGYFAGLDPRRSAEFSFLLGFVTLTAATIYKSYKSGAAMIEVFGWPHVLLGCAIATITAALAVKFLVGWLSRHGMAAFAYYRLAFAVVMAAWMWL